MEAVLDASAVLAWLQKEDGHSRMDELFGRVCISSVNLSEVVTRLSLSGLKEDVIEEALTAMNLHVEPFETQRAFSAGMMAPRTKASGLSLGDRACLSLAEELALPALTADKAWRNVETSAKIEFIR